MSREYRKSRAPWQGPKVNNPYSRANTSLVNDNSDVASISTLNGPTRRTTRRMSIHASAAAQAHGRSFSLAAPFDPSTLPPVPKLPGIHDSSESFVEEEPEPEDEFQGIERKILNELSNGSAAEIDDYFKVLVKQKGLIHKDIMSNINQNQRNILELTNELKDTQNELLQLRVSTKQLYQVLDEFRDSAESVLESRSPEQQVSNKRRDRSSVMVLKKMWATELQSLFKHVEGASKFVQPLPGRHVLAESGRWYEVNVGTWKPVKSAHLFILNDIFLFAVKKNSQESGGESRLQAVQAIPLSDAKLSDITSHVSGQKDDKRYFISVKSKLLSYVFQTDRSDHFLKIFEAYNKGISEQFNQKKLIDSSPGDDPNDEKRQLRESLRNSDIGEPVDEKRKSGSQRQSAEIILQDISARVHSRNRSHDFASYNLKNGNNSAVFEDLRGLEDGLDEVDVEVAHNRYTESVGRIRYIESKLHGIESSIHNGPRSSIEELKLLIDVVKLKVNSRKQKIQQILGFELQNKIDKLTNHEVSEIMEFFYSFDQLDKGISLYLKGTSQYLRSIIAKLAIGVQGSTIIDVLNYLSNLVIVSVSIIKKTILLYEKFILPALKRDQQNEVDSSGLINWCIDEISQVAKSVRKHLYGTLLVSAGTDLETDTPIYKVKDKKLYKELVDNITPYLDDLKTVGVNVSFVFEDIFTQE